MTARRELGREAGVCGSAVVSCMTGCSWRETTSEGIAGGATLGDLNAE